MPPSLDSAEVVTETRSSVFFFIRPEPLCCAWRSIHPGSGVVALNVRSDRRGQPGKLTEPQFNRGLSRTTDQSDAVAVRQGYKRSGWYRVRYMQGSLVFKSVVYPPLKTRLKV